MKNILILLLGTMIVGCSSLHHARISKKFDEEQLIESCRMGRNHDLVRQYLERTNKKLVEIRDTVLSGKNIIELAATQGVADCLKSECIKSDIDILRMFEIFFETQPYEERYIICEIAIKALIKYNTYLHCPHSFTYLLYIIGGTSRLYEILEEDEECKKNWSDKYCIFF